MRDSLLGSDEWNDFLQRIEVETESFFHPSNDGLTILHQAESESVSAHGRICSGFGETLYGSGRRCEVSVTRAEVDHVDTARDELALLRRNRRHRIIRKAEQALGVMRHQVRFSTGLLTLLTPGISTSTTSPALSGPTPAGVPVATMSPGSSVITCDTYERR